MMTMIVTYIKINRVIDYRECVTNKKCLNRNSHQEVISQKSVPQMQNKNQRRKPTRRSIPHKAEYATLLKSHLRTGAPPQVYYTLTEQSPRKAPPKGWFCIDKQLVKILKKDFVKKILRISWETHCFKWLLSLKTFIHTIWQNFLVKENKLTCNK